MNSLKPLAPFYSIVMTNGCFDAIHVGHVALLERIKNEFPLAPLVVFINSDESIKRLKGPSRPIVPERHRQMMLEAIRYVDYVEIFNEDTPLEVMTKWQKRNHGWKTIVVKGRGYGDICDIIAPVGATKIIFDEPDMRVSTTDLIEKMR